MSSRVSKASDFAFAFGWLGCFRPGARGQTGAKARRWRGQARARRAQRERRERRTGERNAADERERRRGWTKGQEASFHTTALQDSAGPVFSAALKSPQGRGRSREPRRFFGASKQSQSFRVCASALADTPSDSHQPPSGQFPPLELILPGVFVLPGFVPTRLVKNESLASGSDRSSRWDLQIGFFGESHRLGGTKHCSENAKWRLECCVTK